MSGDQIKGNFKGMPFSLSYFLVYCRWSFGPCDALCFPHCEGKNRSGKGGCGVNTVLPPLMSTYLQWKMVHFRFNEQAQDGYTRCRGDSTAAVSNSSAPSPPPVLTRKFYEILPLHVVPVLPVFVLKLRHICGCCRSEDYWASSARHTRVNLANLLLFFK